MRGFFRFPSPVDALESRLHAAMTIVVSIPAALLSFLGFPWLWLYLVYGFLARCLCGPRLDPQVSSCDDAFFRFFTNVLLGFPRSFLEAIVSTSGLVETRRELGFVGGHGEIYLVGRVPRGSD